MDQKKYVAYVGTYTHGSSKGIHIYDLDVENGRAVERKVVPINNPSYIKKSHNEKYLYSISDEGVQSFRILPDGDLDPMNSASIRGMRGCYLSTDREDRFLFVGGWHDGKVTVMRLNEDGTIGEMTDEIFHKGLGSVAERNFRPHVNCVRPTPDNKYLCAVDNGIDQVKIYSIDRRTNKLRLVDILRCKRESGPRIIRFSADGRFAYLLFELSNEINVYSYDGTGKNPQFELLQSVSTLSDELDEMHDAASGLALAPDGKHLFCSTAGDNTVAMYKIDAQSGFLTKKFALPISGEYPKDLAIFPDCRHLAVVNHESNSITTFAIDYENSLLIQKGRPLKVETPNCIMFSKIEG